MNKYTDLQGKHSKLINDFPMGFAFSDKQFSETKKKMNVTDNNELLSIAGNGFIKKTDRIVYRELMEKIFNEDNEAMKDDEYLYQGFIMNLLTMNSV